MSTLNGFDELESLSKKLNEESDQVNEIIKDFENRLVNLNLGTEVWLGEEPSRLSSLSLQEPPLETWDDDETTFTIRLGFTNVLDDGWRVAVATFTVRGGDEPFCDGPSNIRPLLESSRTQRLEAVAQFPRLLEKLRWATTDLLSRIGAAKEALGIGDAEGSDEG